MPLQFVLLPISHLGERRFFADVAERARGCDLLVVEGIIGMTRRGGMLTTPRPRSSRSYYGLIEDDNDYGALGVPVITPDITGQEFDAGWQSVPLSKARPVSDRVPGLSPRPANDVEPPRPGLGHEADPGAGQRRQLAVVRAHTYGRSPGWSTGPEARRGLAAIHHERAHEHLRVAVIYGAAHMLAGIEALRTLGYQPNTSEWLTVFEY